MDSLYIIVTASLFSIACGLLGVFLILKRMAMLGDAISHAVLPGIVLAFMLTGSRDSIYMILGASLVGILTTFLIEFFHSRAKLQTDAAIGVTFTWLFALGVILISVFAGQVDLDQECVLYGEIAYIPLDLWITDNGTVMGPRTMYVALSLCILVSSLIYWAYCPLKICTFDRSFAATLGISVVTWHYVLMSTVSLSTVAAFDSVGAVLVVALFVIAPATSYLITNKLSHMIGYTILLSIFNSIGGYALSAWLNSSIAGSIVSFSGVIFFVVFIGQLTWDQLQITQVQTTY